MFQLRGKKDYLLIHFLYKNIFYGKENVIKSDRELFSILKEEILKINDVSQELDMPSRILLEELSKAFEARYLIIS